MHVAREHQKMETAQKEGTLKKNSQTVAQI